MLQPRKAKDPAPWLLIALWSYGASVRIAPDGVLSIAPHASGRRIPAALLAAARRHDAALTEWVVENR